MLEAPGLKMVLFAEDPNLRRETLDIAVIGPELRKALGAAVASGWYTAVSEGRALGARYGIRKFPAVALFRGAEYLGAAEGLMGWDEYIQALVEIGPVRRALRARLRSCRKRKIELGDPPCPV